MNRYFYLGVTLFVGFGVWLSLPRTARADTTSPRQMQLLNGPDWQFFGAGATETLPGIDSDGFKSAAWAPVSVPHNFQTRTAYDTLTKGWYKRQVTVDASAQGKELYLVFEGVASIADVYVNVASSRRVTRACSP
jgi:beta-galactosidase/beta-glucuronidase